MTYGRTISWQIQSLESVFVFGFVFFFGQEAASNTTRATSFFQGSLEKLAWCAPCWSCGDCLGILAQPSFCFIDLEAQRGQSCSRSDSRTGHVSFSLLFLLQDASLSPPHSFSRCLSLGLWGDVGAALHTGQSHTPLTEPHPGRFPGASCQCRLLSESIAQ